MTRLSVNVNKIATLRNARGGDNPNLVQVVKDCEKYGAEGITVHPRNDERHVTMKDVYDIASIVKTDFNIEGYPDKRFLKIINDIVPDQVTLVPDPPEVLTSNIGWRKSDLNVDLKGFKKLAIVVGTSIQTKEGATSNLINSKVETFSPIQSMVVVTSPIGDHAPPAFAAIIIIPANQILSLLSTTNFRRMVIKTIVAVRLSIIADKIKARIHMIQSSLLFLLV